MHARGRCCCCSRRVLIVLRWLTRCDIATTAATTVSGVTSSGRPATRRLRRRSCGRRVVQHVKLGPGSGRRGQHESRVTIALFLLLLLLLLVLLLLEVMVLLLVVLFHGGLLSWMDATIRRRPEHRCVGPAEQVLVVLMFKEHQVHRISAKR